MPRADVGDGDAAPLQGEAALEGVFRQEERRVQVGVPKAPNPDAKQADIVIARMDSTLPPIMSPIPSLRAIDTISIASETPAFMSLMLNTRAARSRATRRASAADETLSSAATVHPDSSPSARIPARSSLGSHCSRSTGEIPRDVRPWTSCEAEARLMPALPSSTSGESGEASSTAEIRARSASGPPGPPLSPLSCGCPCDE